MANLKNPVRGCRVQCFAKLIFTYYDQLCRVQYTIDFQQKRISCFQSRFVYFGLDLLAPFRVVANNDKDENFTGKMGKIIKR